MLCYFSCMVVSKKITVQRRLQIVVCIYHSLFCPILAFFFSSLSSYLFHNRVFDVFSLLSAMLVLYCISLFLVLFWPVILGHPVITACLVQFSLGIMFILILQYKINQILNQRIIWTFFKTFSIFPFLNKAFSQLQPNHAKAV